MTLSQISVSCWLYMKHMHFKAGFLLFSEMMSIDCLKLSTVEEKRLDTQYINKFRGMAIQLITDPPKSICNFFNMTYDI